MLTLTRREGESIILQIQGLAPIEVFVHEIDARGQARLSFDAPRDVEIFRKEVLERIRQSG